MSIVIGNFVKGWQNRAQQADMNDDALFKVVDLSFDVAGALVCRNLHSLHDPLSVLAETSAIGDLFVVDVEGEGVRRIYYTVGTTLYRYLSSTSVTSAIATSVGSRRFTYASAKPALADYSHVYITNGTTMITDDGVNTYTWGIDGPDNLPTLADAGLTGNLSAGEYKYRYTFYDTTTGAESNPSNVGVGLTVGANDAVLVTNIQRSTNSRVNARRLYRTVANGGSYYLVATITDNRVTSYYDHKADTDLTLQLDDDQGVPPTAYLADEFDDYVMLAGDVNYLNRVWFSIARNYDNFPSTYYVNVGSPGNRLKALRQFEERFYAVSSKGVSAISGSDPDTFEPHESRAHVGTYVGESVAVGHDGLYYLSYDGVYHYDGAQSKRISDMIKRLFGHTRGTWYDIVDKASATDVARGVFLLGKYYLLLPLKRSDGSTTNAILVYDTVDKIWNLYEVACDDIFADVTNGVLLGAKQTYGAATYTVYKLFDSGRSSVDVPEPEFVTKSYDMTEAGEYSRAKKEVTSGFTIRGGQDIGYLNKFRVDAVGTWTFYFYINDTLRFTKTLSNLSSADIDTWHKFEPQIKGRYVYVRAVAGGTPTPTTCIFREMEIK